MTEMPRPISADLTSHRDRIDDLDREILERLARRFAVCLEVARLKKSENIPMMQPARVEQVVTTRTALGRDLGMPAHFVGTLYRLIIGEACRLEDEVIGAAADHSTPLEQRRPEGGEAVGEELREETVRLG